MARWTVSHRWFTLQYPVRSQIPAWAGSSLAQTIGAIGPSSARSTSPIWISVGLAGELVAAVGAARAVDEAGFAEADDELLQIRPRQDLVIGHLSEADRAGAVVPGELDHHPHAVLASRREVHGAGAGEDAARPRLLRLACVSSRRDGPPCRRQRRVEPGGIPSYHVRIESSRASGGLQSPPRPAEQRSPASQVLRLNATFSDFG